MVQGVGGTQESIREVLEEVDKDGDGRIDYDEFCVMMRGSEAPSTSKKQKGRKGAL
jgi:Ca2+-binding EF-hand superfamily protein